MVSEFMKRHQKREDPDKPQSRNPRYRGSQNPSRSIIAREYLSKKLTFQKPPETTKSTAQLAQEKKAAKKERDPKNVKEAMKKFARKIHQLAKEYNVGQRCSSNEPDCPKNKCCMKSEGQMYGVCQRFPVLQGQCTDMCGCNHNSGASGPKLEMECRRTFLAGVNSEVNKCVYKTEPVSADVLGLRKLSNAKRNGKNGAHKKKTPKKTKTLPMMEIKKMAKQQSQTTSS